MEFHWEGDKGYWVGYWHSHSHDSADNTFTKNNLEDWGKKTQDWILASWCEDILTHPNAKEENALPYKHGGKRSHKVWHWSLHK